MPTWSFKKKDDKAAEIVGNRAVAAAECDHPHASRVSQYGEVEGVCKVIRVHCELCGVTLLPPEDTAA
ncbi:MAG: hypothetical protein QF719_08270 [Chloroflexota bacterium]|nr:hypothetical protein [Chloroflexota bacterium]MDP6508827.1 hypothetical protein [Chloroflexota bacterium]MDP6758189.1 hypothetical protein [Chloroflexota bacterium]